jgi:hypothetical protein
LDESATNAVAGKAGVDRYSDNSIGILSSQGNEAFGVNVRSFPCPILNQKLTKEQKDVPGWNGIDSDRVSTAPPSRCYGDSMANGYMDQQDMFGTSVPLWNSENLHEDLLAEFLPQYGGVLWPA